MASYGPQIEKLVRYITAAWCDPDLVFADKWNVSEFYPIMLMCDCLVRLLYHWDQGHLPEISEELIAEKVPLVLWQALMQTLQKQNANGSYGETPSHLQSLCIGRTEGQKPQCFLGGLKKARDAMFDRKGMKKDDYLAFIPSTVCCANNLQGSFIKADILHDFMVLIMRVYQLDEYMEHIVAKELKSNLPDVGNVIREIFQPDGSKRNVKRAVAQAKEAVQSSESHTNGLSNGNSAKSSNGHTHPRPNGLHNGAGNGHANGASEPSLLHKNTFPAALSALKDRLQSLVASIVHQPQVLAANAYNKQQLHRELRECLLAHVTQITDSRQAMQPDQERDWLPQTSYHTWLRTTGSSHSCAPLSLAYLLCLISREQKQTLKAAETYVVQDICMHLGNKARLENDRASYARDKREGNLNSLDFPEFLSAGSDDDRKAHLAPIIEYERKCCVAAMGSLRDLMAGQKSPGCGEVLEMLEFYLFLTDVYNDVYVMRDISCSA
ncbi:hypothetical protein BJX96DRAFT_167693 [Aspergillus floccosus]